MLQQAGVQVQMGRCTVERYTSSWSTVQGWRSDLWWVPDNTYLWPLDKQVRSTATRAYWWNFWTPSPITVSGENEYLLHLRASAKLGWMETWDIASVVLVSFVNHPPRNNQGRELDWDTINTGFQWHEDTNPCTRQRVYRLLGGAQRPARLMATTVEANHPWKVSPDAFQQAVAQGHRTKIQVGVVQSVEKFSKGKFSYTGHNAGGDLWYYLPSDPPEGIPADPRYAKPPLLDTISCPGDGIQHAWYSNRGGAQEVNFPVDLNKTLRAKSYDSLGNDWRANIGYSDSPAFVVQPSMVMPPLQFSLDRNQNGTPTLFFYDAIAARTLFFPYSYVPVIRLKAWSIRFDGEVEGVNQYRGRGALEHNAALEKPETGYGPYNDYIRGQWQWQRR